MTVVCAAGEPASVAFFVLGGSASVLIRPPGAPFDVCVKRFGAGFSFGEPALLSADARRSATVRADRPAMAASASGAGTGTGTGAGAGTGAGGSDSSSGHAATTTSSGGVLEVLTLTREAYEAVCREDSGSNQSGNGQSGSSKSSGGAHDEFEAEARAAAEKVKREAALALAAIPIDTRPHRFQPSRFAPRWRKIVGIQCVVSFFGADVNGCRNSPCVFWFIVCTVFDVFKYSAYLWFVVAMHSFSFT
jgi:hypothetical protein